RVHRGVHGLGGGREDRARRPAGAGAARAVHHRLRLRRRAHDGGDLLADADGEDLGGARPAPPGGAPLLLGADRPDHRRGHRLVRDAGRREPGGARRADRLRRPARDRADDQAGAPGGVPDLGVPPGARDAGRHRRPAEPEGGDRPPAAAHARPPRRRGPRRRGPGPGARMTLDELTPWLFARTSGGIRWGLERTEELLAGVGDPHRHFRSVLIGGTNGKGSVAALCDSVLREAAGGRIGLYTSPHLVSFSERIRVDGVPVADDVLAAAAARLRASIERTGASFFEATTAMALLAFADAGVEMAVVEVGLGGRLDATNLLTPLVTAVTNVARDHEEYLGDDLAGIAREKGGIFKEGVPALTS